ncbi:cell envelope biogenesis protein TolA [Nocardiopsis sp. NPDC058631]|uniref:cell envelope biogenesis protein TolA n=1 Tax=Nocardiopsis sp. NPDC058631 TaxID=3346566 RepID=UPI003661F04D
MKFELVEPPEESATTDELPYPALAGEPEQEQTAPLSAQDRDESLLKPVRERMAGTVEGVRASLDLLRARVAEQSMTQPAVVPPASESDSGREFHPHRFAAPTHRGER